MHLLLATDAWAPQINGVVRTWQHVIAELEALGHRVTVVHPGLFRTVAAPRYPEIRLALCPGRRVAALVREQRPDAIHVATEGPVGQAARKHCLRHRLPFTTSYHTQFPQYLKAYFGIPPRWTFAFVRRFHNAGRATLVPTPAVGRELEANGFRRVVVWSRGVDTRRFRPMPPTRFADLPRPIFLYAGRVAREKNIEAFLDLDLPGSKVVVGDGPARTNLQRRYPHVYWTGMQSGDDLVACYASADVFVFPSRTDTFGVVMLEANACGLPVAAFPVTGPIDVVRPGVTGVLDDDLAHACLAAAKLDRDACRAHAATCTWRRCAEIVLENLAPIVYHRDRSGHRELPMEPEAANPRTHSP